MEPTRLIAKTFQGLEEILAKELSNLGAENIEIGRRMVAFTGDKEMMYRANFCLRTAIRILKPIATFKANTADEVYDAVKAINWNDFLDLDTSFAVDSVVYSEDFKHSKFVAYKVKDAIVDYFREKTGKRPNICVTNPDIKFNMHISNNECTLSLDSSGESLHKRGYRIASVESPINEVLAAGIILLTGWNGECDLIDPMCGSGTIAIEAALIARNIAPGVFRQKFAFENWKDFDKDLLDSIYNDDSNERPFNHKIYAYDIDKNAILIAQENIKSAGVATEITAAAQSIVLFKQPAEKSIIVTNPPYGERISVPDLLDLYKKIGEKLKHQFIGNEAWLISYHEETFDQIGLKPSVKIPLFNGALDCELRKYQIFDGKLDNFRSQGNILKTDEERERNANKRKPKQHRNPTNTYNNKEEEEGESEIPYYMMKRHREFVQSQQKESRGSRERRYEDDKQHSEHGLERKNFTSQRDKQNKKDNDFNDSNNRNRNNFKAGQSFNKGGKPQNSKFKGDRNNKRFSNRYNED